MFSLWKIVGGSTADARHMEPVFVAAPAPLLVFRTLFQQPENRNRLTVTDRAKGL